MSSGWPRCLQLPPVRVLIRPRWTDRMWWCSCRDSLRRESVWLGVTVEVATQPTEPRGEG
eukprot:scaffold408_cov388-Prasinococcus_capsulatus_cf.AAC.8